jgi:hypothetical protein
LTDVKAYMGHADISTTMIYVHHVPRVDAAVRLSRLVAAAESVPRLRPVSGHIRDIVVETDDAVDAQTGTVTELPEWARLDSNQGPTDYESERPGYGLPPTTTDRLVSRAFAGLR